MNNLIMEDIDKSRQQQMRGRIHEEVLPTFKSKSKLELSFIIDALHAHFIFNNLTDSHESVGKAMLYAEITQGKFIFREGYEADSFFVIQNGIVQVLLGQDIGRTLTSGEGFGEMALLNSSLRVTSVRAKTNCSMWMIDRVGFKQAVQQAIIQQFEHNRQYLQSLKFYAYLDNQKKDLISASLVQLKFSKGQMIVEEGDPGSSFYVIKSGTAVVLSGSKEVGKLSPGQNFGQNSLYYNVIRKVSVRAQEQVVCFGLGRQTLSRVLGPNFHKIVFTNFIKTTLDKSQWLSDLKDSQFQSLTNRFSLLSKTTGEKLILKNQKVQRLFIVVQGYVKKNRMGVTVAGPGGLVGQEFIIGESRPDDDYIMESDGVVLQTGLLQQFKPLNNEQVQERGTPRMQLQLLDEVSFLSNFEFGKVYRGFSKGKPVFNIREYFKKSVQDQYKNIINQLKALTRLSGLRFFPVLKGVWQNQSSLFICEQLIRGEQLYEVIRRIGLLSSKDAQFYVGNILCIIEDLKQHRVINRDLKPQNFIVDERGWLHLVNFQSAKKLEGITSRTNSVIGTPHYMAPEVIMGASYNWLVDLWSLGIMFYQFLCGKVPYAEQKLSPMDIFEQIMKKQLIFPASLKDKRAKRLIQVMLSRMPQYRHGGNLNLLKKEEWLVEANCEGIRRGQVSGPQAGLVAEQKSLREDCRKMKQATQDKKYQQFNS